MSTLDKALIFTEILPRLPVKSLMRFKCVSKSFKFEISSRNFTQLYLRYHSVSSDSDLLILLGEKGLFCYDLDFTSSISTVTSTFEWENGFGRVVGSCNGLLCIVIHNYGYHFSVINPTTRICQDIRLPDNDSSTDNIGFAFDPENLDYKIVSISVEPNGFLITKVYSLNAGSWKILASPFPACRFPDDMLDVFESGVLINNHLLHWTFITINIPNDMIDDSQRGVLIKSDNLVPRRRIACFDVCKNEWIDDVLFPHSYYDLDEDANFCYIAAINEKLCSSFKNKVDSCFDVWMMNEYGVQDSWVKLLSIQDSDCLPWGVIPIACNRRSGRFLIRMQFSNRFLWCDSSGGGLTEVTFGDEDDGSDFPAFICKRSLVHLPDGYLFLNGTNVRYTITAPSAFAIE